MLFVVLLYATESWVYLVSHRPVGLLFRYWYTDKTVDIQLHNARQDEK
jgi:hypothetical protein